MAVFASYSRVIVDEYQDCDPDQHAVVCHLATILPTVVLGDPMQEIFNWRGHHPNWDDDVVGSFPLVAELTRPWRWENAGAHELGAWLLDARRTLKAGGRIDLQTAPSEVSWVHLDGSADHEKQRLACLTRSPRAGGEVLIMTGGVQKDLQRKLAKQTPGAVTVEAVDLTDVTDFAREVDFVAPGNLEAAPGPPSHARPQSAHHGFMKSLRLPSIRRGAGPTQFFTCVGTLSQIRSCVIMNSCH